MADEKISALSDGGAVQATDELVIARAGANFSLQGSVFDAAGAAAAAQAASQPLDADLTSIAALNSATAGAIASDGSGWIKKTYAQFKTALGLTASDVGLGNVTNNAQVTSVTAADTSIVVAGTTSPTVRTNTLDVIATQHPPAANWSNNSHKITSVTDPTAAQDAATKNYVDTNTPGNAGGKGHLTTATAVNAPADLAPGANKTVLTADSTQATGLAWTTADPTEIVVDPPTGVAATDNAAIVAAITACPAGGVVQLQAGTYALGTSSPGLTISTPITLRGHGGADALWANFGTRLTFDSATGIAIQQSCHGVKYENFALENIHSTAPTAGAGIRTVTGGGNSTHYGPNLSVKGFFYNVDHQAGAEWFMDPSCFMYDFVFCGLRIQNVDLVDGGDMVVSGLFVAGPNNNSTAGIYWMSGGGFKGYDIKINNRNSKTMTVGVAIELQDGVTTQDFLLTGSSIENCSWGVLCEHAAGSTHTGVFHNIVIVGNQFATVGGAATSVVAIEPATTLRVSGVVVGENIITGGALQDGITYKNVANGLYGPNRYATVANSFVDAGGNSVTNADLCLTSPLSTKGDLWGFSTVNAALGVGANGKILVADSGQTLGVGYSTRDLDAATHKIANVTDPASAQDAATKAYVDSQVAASGVSSIDTITGAITLTAGSNITITDNSPSGGHITIAASATGSGNEISYTQITSPINVTSTTESSGTSILAPGAITFDGAPVICHVFALVTSNNTTASNTTLCLFEGATELTRLTTAFVGSSSGNNQLIIPCNGFFRFTPTAGSHTYTVTAFVPTTAGTPQIAAGAGGTAGAPPAFIRFTKA